MTGMFRAELARYLVNNTNSLHNISNRGNDVRYHHAEASSHINLLQWCRDKILTVLDLGYNENSQLQNSSLFLSH